jgi:hypothetical protein
MLPRQAAPHSDACICNRTGVITLRFGDSDAVLSPALLEALGGILGPPHSQECGQGLSVKLDENPAFPTR